jgi:hypothetical protein
LGEVIIRNNPKNFKWVTYKEANKNDKIPKIFARDLTTAFILVKKSTGEFLFPLAKTYKFIQSGKEDSVWIFGMWALDIKSKKIAVFELRPVKKKEKNKDARN